MQNLLIFLSLVLQDPGAINPTPQAPTKTPQVPGKVLPVPLPPTKAPEVPVKALPQEQKPAPQASPQTEVLGPVEQAYFPEYGCHCVGQKILKGAPADIGKWRVKYKVVSSTGESYTYKASGTGAQSYAQYGDPYGFANYLNSYRASCGLPPLAYDPNLSAWASQNNAAQSRRGLGHHINPGARQNSGWNYANASSVFQGWRNSSGHNANMLAQGSTYGIAYGPGPYWTLNVK